jgi:membrane protease YdiL (CAAX protease family)
MLAVDVELWQVADTGLGALLLILLVARHLARGWPDPLARIPLPRSEPNLVDAVVVLLAYFTLQFAVAGLVKSWYPDADFSAAGSHTWHVLQAATGVTSILIAAYAAFVIYRYRTGAATPQRGVDRRLAAALVGVLVALPIVNLQLFAGNLVWIWIAGAETLPEHPVLDAIRLSAWGPAGVVQLFIGAIVIAPVVEELIFRGVFLSALRGPTQGHWLGILGSSIVFALLHIAQPQAVLPLFTLGLVLGFVRVWTGRLWPCILLHTLFNARTMVYTVLSGGTT